MSNMNYSPIFPTLIGHTIDLEFTNKIIPIAKEYLNSDDILSQNPHLEKLHG